jgi:hypothetical protein
MRTAQVAQVIPSTSKRTVVGSPFSPTRDSTEDCVALLLDGVLDLLEIDLGLVIGDVEGGLRNRHLDGADTAKSGDGAFETGLAMVAVDFWDL